QECRPPHHGHSGDGFGMCVWSARGLLWSHIGVVSSDTPQRDLVSGECQSKRTTFICCEHCGSARHIGCGDDCHRAVCSWLRLFRACKRLTGNTTPSPSRFGSIPVLPNRDREGGGFE